ncbi:hypothetical protein RB601_009637 [Gaeumannomyces tritici]
MNENPFSPLPPGLVLSSSTPRQLWRSSPGTSPTRQRPTDELLATLTPTAAIEALRNPTGTLKQCLDAATLSDQSFAMAAAIASKKIQDWLDELSSWQWPSGSGSAGFDPSSPRGRGRTGHSRWDSITSEDLEAVDSNPASDNAWLGCLQAQEAASYERRIAEIQRELDEIDIETIKRHVLHNHILPLSRPGTPMSDCGRSISSASMFYNRMDDVTALLTATVVQALPNLSKLMRLMNTWSVRLLLLRKAPSTIAFLDDAEVALRSGWNAVDLGKRRSAASTSPDSPTTGTLPALSHKDFDVMKLVLDQKISTAARAIDFMLDTLDGRPETIPDEWVDRMDKLEKNYAEWVAVCERVLRETEWAMANGTQMAQHTPSHSPKRAAQPSSTASSPVSLASVVRHDVPASPSVSEGSMGSPGLDRESLSPEHERVMGSAFSDRSSSSGSEMTATATMRSVSMSSNRTVTAPLPRTRSREVRAAMELSPPGSPSLTPSLMPRDPKSRSVSFSGMPVVPESDVLDEDIPPKSSLEPSPMGDKKSEQRRGHTRSPSDRSDDDQLQQQISEILESIPAKIHLSSQPTPVNHLNPPDLQLPHLKRKSSAQFDRSQQTRSHSSLSASSRAGSRAGTPSFLLAPAYARNTRSRAQRSNQDIKLYHLSRSSGEAPIKLFIRCVGDNGERVMVRVGGGWADLGEYLKEYAIHHGRRSKVAGETTKIEIQDLPGMPSKITSSPASRPASAMDSPITPLNVRKTRRSFGPDDAIRHHLPLAAQLPRTPVPLVPVPGPEGDSADTPPSGVSTRSRSSSRLSWTEEDSSLGMSGPRSKNVEMSDESRAWVASVKEKVRIASGDRRVPFMGTPPPEIFGEMGKVGGTKRLFRRG